LIRRQGGREICSKQGERSVARAAGIKTREWMNEAIGMVVDTIELRLRLAAVVDKAFGAGPWQACLKFSQ
jgi:hypothetical protein